MKSRITFVLSLLFSCLFTTLFAQPEHYSCHHAKHQIPMNPLTEADLAILAASNSRSDTFDIINYGINLEVTDFAGQTISGHCEVTFASKMDNVNEFNLDLLNLTIDSITMGDVQLAYTYNGLLISITTPMTMNAGDEATFNVYYHGHPTVDPSGFGGFAFAEGYAYNLGIGLTSNPYNFGRSWFPCFDNFVERSTYDFNIISSGTRKAFCVGTFLEEIDLGGTTVMRRYRMEKAIPTYLVGVAVSTYRPVDYVHQGVYGPIDIQLVARGNDTTAMKNTFVDLGTAVDALESWFGPYVWDRVGYVITTVGAMEHPGNIAYPDFVGVGGNTFSHRRLMSHELGHCWWGNITNMSTPDNMWIKEGNAEYSAHLFTEYLDGHNAFIKQVKDNHIGVLKAAHIVDGAFLPLSGIPFESTYSNHTYLKGAAMMHNLRTYLGDTQFSLGMQSILDAYTYEAIDEVQFKDQLATTTGYNLDDFFDAWIYNPGYSVFEFNDVTITPTAGQYMVDLEIQQKLYAAPEFHKNVPLVITFMDEDYNHHVANIMASDELTELQVMVPFEPSIWFLNEDQQLNMGQMASQKKVNSTGPQNFSYSEMVVSANSVVDSAWLRVEHLWAGADPIIDNPFNASISKTHYWKVDGIIPNGNEFNGLINFNGVNQNALDYDLVNITEDSLILAYRATPNEAWREYEDYLIIPGSTTDAKGVLQVSILIPGEYALANGELPLAVSTNNFVQDLDIKLFPNPTSETLHIQTGELPVQQLLLKLFTLDGKAVSNTNQSVVSANSSVQLAVNDLKHGAYILQFSDQSGRVLGSKTIEIIN